MQTLIKNGTIVTALGEYQADIAIDGEKISMIGRNLPGSYEKVIDAAGRYVLPGGVDNHSHFEALNSDGVTFNAGYDTSYVAVLGGTTTVVDFASNDPGKSLIDSINYRLEVRAKGKVVPDIALHALCTDFSEETLEEIPKLVEMGVPTMKMFMAYKPTPMYMDDFKLLKTMQKAAEHGMTMFVHAENADVLNVLRDQYAEKGLLAPKYHYMTRPPYSESEAVSRAVTFAKAVRCPLCVVHVSCAEAAEVIKNARADGAPVVAETCPHYLVLDKHKMDDPDFDQSCRWVCSPALRDKADQDYLWDALKRDAVSLVGSDHAPIPMYQKYWGKDDFRAIPNGSPGSGDRLNVLWTYGVAAGRITRRKLVEIFAATPARLCGIYPQKGDIAVGSDADLVIFDPGYEGTFSVETNPTGVEYNAYEGMAQRGRPETVLLRGTVVVEAAKFVGTPGSGRFVPGKPYGMAYDLL
ncbi:MAG: dihydropyrimidinase [Oscillibacter sp.]|nr:dihydropyrimidinase [Oscillibacter sp.]